MRVLPTSGREWLSLILFPFKVYTALAVMFVFIWGSALAGHPRVTAVSDVGLLVIAGYLISAVVLLLGGVIQSCVGQRASAIANYLFGAVAFIITIGLAPLFAFA